MKTITMPFKDYQQELVQSHEDGYAECYKKTHKIIQDLLNTIDDNKTDHESEAIVRAMVWIDDE